MSARDGAPRALPDLTTPDDVSVARWFAFYAALALAAVAAMALLGAGHDWAGAAWTAPGLSLGARWARLLQAFAAAPTGVKLLGFALFVSLCSTFLPLPTGPLVAAVATRDVAVAEGIWTTALTVAAVAGAASTVANLNDYHLFTWMLRHHRVARIRQTRLFETTARWFGRSPFVILLIANFLPIPIDVIRILAATYRYPRLRFAAANFIGRFVRYGVIAYVTYALGEKGWIAAVALLALALAIGLARAAAPLWRRRRRKTDARAPA